MPHPGRHVLVGRARLGGLYGDIRKGMDSLEESAAQAHLLRPFSPLQTALARHATSGKACTCRKAVAAQVLWRCPERDRCAGRIGCAGSIPCDRFPHSRPRLRAMLCLEGIHSSKGPQPRRLPSPPPTVAHQARLRAMPCTGIFEFDGGLRPSGVLCANGSTLGRVCALAVRFG